MEEITLTSQELEDIKDDIKFKANITLEVKHINHKLDKLNGITDDVKSLKTHRAIHWFLLSAITGGLFFMAFRVLARQ